MFIKAWNWISNVATAWGLLPSSIATYVTTFIWTTAMAIAGYAQSVPVFWLLLGLPLVAASIFTFVLRASELRERHRVKDKIAFVSPRIMRKVGVAGAVEGVALGFQLQSHAPFSIDFELQSLESELGDFYPPKKQYLKKRFTIPPNGTAWFDDFLITIPKQGPKTTMQGKVSFKVRYGVGENLRYPLERKADVFIGFDEHGGYEGSNWQEG